MSDSQLSSDLERKFGADLRQKNRVSAQQLTTFAVGGEVNLMLEPKRLATLHELIEVLNHKGVSWRVLGAGSNVVLPDQGFSDVLIRFGRDFSGYSLYTTPTENSLEQCFTELGRIDEAIGAESESFLIAFAAAPLMSLSRKLSALGLSGLEFAAGIPGSIGGGVTMNAGAHGEQMSDVVSRVWCLSEKMELSCFAAHEMKFAYRSSRITERDIVLAAEMRLSRRPIEDVMTRRSDCLAYRKKTQPLHLPSAGSTFKNPDKSQSEKSAGELLEAVGIKGQYYSGVCFSDLHANWLVKSDNSAKASAVAEMISRAKTMVVDSFGVELQSEIQLW